MQNKTRYKTRKRTQTKKKEVRNALFGFTGVIIGGLIAAFASFGNTYFGNTLHQKENKIIEYYEIMNSIADLETIISEEFYIYMGMRHNLAGHELYGNNFMEEYRKSGKNTANFTVNKRKEINIIQARIERWFLGEKLKRITVPLNSLMDIETLFIEIFLDQQDTLRWKREPLTQDMLMHIYQNEIDACIQQLYMEVKLLYEKD